MRIMNVGIDLDNTLIDYREAYSKISKSMNLQLKETDKTTIKNYLTDSQNDDFEWQRFQSILYTQGLEFAETAPGLIDFLNYCKNNDVKVFLISHKTLTTPREFGSQDLRTPALDWLRRKNVIPDLVSLDNIYFCESKNSKINKIVSLKCDLFVDDLKEILNSEHLSSNTKKVLYSPVVSKNSICNFLELIQIMENL
jgi:hypothetical protein